MFEQLNVFCPAECEEFDEIESQLNILNDTATRINEFENRLLYSRTCYENTFREESRRLNSLGVKLKKSIARSRPFYEAREQHRQRQRDIQKASERYRLSCLTLTSAHESLAETESLISTSKFSMDVANLERLNNCVSQVNKAQMEVSHAKQAHEQSLGPYAEEETALRQLGRKHKNDIHKAKPYFTMLRRFNECMKEAQLHVQVCTQQVQLCKSLYSEAMSNLEHISDSVHRSKRLHSKLNHSRTKAVSTHLFSSMDHLDEKTSDVITTPVTNGQVDLKSDKLLRFFSVDSSSTSSSLRRTCSEPMRLISLNGLLQHIQQADVDLKAFHVRAQPSEYLSNSIEDTSSSVQLSGSNSESIMSISSLDVASQSLANLKLADFDREAKSDSHLEATSNPTFCRQSCQNLSSALYIANHPV